MRVAILTVSDRAHSGEYRDETGPAIAALLPDEIIATTIVPDERRTIAATLRQWCDSGDIELVLTNGGTGLSKRDVTPEATLDVIDRTIPGIAEVMRAHGRSITPLADLSRQVAGQRANTIIVNLPGSPKGALESLAAIQVLLTHAVSVISGGHE